MVLTVLLKSLYVSTRADGCSAEDVSLFNVIPDRSLCMCARGARGRAVLNESTREVSALYHHADGVT
eukprot:13143840-Heterocapsa_arctica.AAC.1